MGTLKAIPGELLINFESYFLTFSYWNTQLLEVVTTIQLLNVICWVPLLGPQEIFLVVGWGLWTSVVGVGRG